MMDNDDQLIPTIIVNIRVNQRHAKSLGMNAISGPTIKIESH